MANTTSSRPMVGGGLYSLRGGQVQPVSSPAPGINVPESPMTTTPTQQQGSSINMGELLGGLMKLYGATGQQGAGQQQESGNIFSMLKGLFGSKGATGTGTVPQGSIQPGVNYSTLGRTYGM